MPNKKLKEFSRPLVPLFVENLNSPLNYKLNYASKIYLYKK